MIAKTISVPRNKWQKLWAWCLTHSETKTVNVAVYVNCAGGYRLKEDQKRKRIGRACPDVRRVMRFVPSTGREVVAYSEIRWSYVY